MFARMSETRTSSSKAPASVYFFLMVGLVAASQSGNIIRLGDAHPAAIAAWRLLLASAMLFPLAAGELRALAALTRRERVMLLLSGVALAFHFFLWIGAVQRTTVANAALFFAINPVITALAARLLFKEKLGKALALSILMGVAGVLVLGGGDLSVRPDHLPGNLMAIGCSVLFTVYFLLGKKLRTRLPTAVYVTACYGVAATVGFICLLALRLPIVSYSGRTWLCFLMMAVIPTMIGHTSINHAVRYLAAGWISAATLCEPLFAGLVAYLVWGEDVTIHAVLGYVLIAVSVLMTVVSVPSTGLADPPERDEDERDEDAGACAGADTGAGVASPGRIGRI